MTNRLYYGDNLAILRDHIADGSVDLVYLDPPFNSNATYNVLFRAPDGQHSQAQIEAFEDTWHWNEAAEDSYWRVLNGPNTEAARMLEAMRGFLGDNDMMAYLAMMAIRLIELHRVLKATGSLYLHCDPTASHYLKILLDAVFGARHYKSEIVWKRSSAHNDTKQGLANYGHIHDVIHYCTKSSDWTWNTQFTPYEKEYTGRDYKLVEEVTGRRFRRGDLTAAKPGGDVSYEWRVKKRAHAKERWVADLDDEYLNPRPGWDYKGVFPYGGRYWAYSKANMRKYADEGRIRHTFDGMPEYKRYLDEMPGVPLQDMWSDIRPLLAHERMGYPTEKPPALLERIIAASSNEGDVVLDPFCGCGTTVHAAQKLNRQWIGIDITHLAIALVERRLREAFAGIAFETVGVPKDVGAAGALADRDKHEFEKWAISLVPDAQPFRGGRKGPDSGIDGVLYFKLGARGTDTGKAIVSVKGGQNVQVSMVRDLKAVVEREKALIGLFLTLAPPTRPMTAEAAAAGFVELDQGRFAKIQILTIAGLLDRSERPQLPVIASSYRAARREEEDTQGDLAL